MMSTFSKIFQKSRGQFPPLDAHDFKNYQVFFTVHDATNRVIE